MSFFISDALAAAPAATQQPGIEGMLFPLGILVFFYFLFLRPQSKRTKEKKQMIAAITKGAEVVTSGGILGKIVDLDDNFVKIEISDNTFIQVQRQSIESMMPKGTYKAITKKAVKA
ncbi:preprotein translocase subunit YajC [Methylobacter sp. S3L5C]|jgi:preprotein translocase subunit YajC|uniref:preprotein translocase subunit YajC n=1 Tax=Methylobacter sp. S3L5C TaxID=2839024 RepID=UPI001FABF511|nr:preprotein translocase subunit YajC [Methylobacter sp. S3L5C]UOA10414.1 preprotein translocase subunit YajC [Methylobacter sp. S3L5C]